MMTQRSLGSLQSSLGQAGRASRSSSPPGASSTGRRTRPATPWRRCGCGRRSPTRSSTPATPRTASAGSGQTETTLTGDELRGAAGPRPGAPGRQRLARPGRPRRARRRGRQDPRGRCSPPRTRRTSVGRSSAASPAAARRSTRPPVTYVGAARCGEPHRRRRRDRSTSRSTARPPSAPTAAACSTTWPTLSAALRAGDTTAIRAGATALNADMNRIQVRSLRRRHPLQPAREGLR